MSSTEVSEFRDNFKIAKETFGVGTRTAFAESFPSKDGITFVTAFPAPVEVITILIAAERPLLGFLCILSNKFWSLVYECTVSRCPFSMPYFSSTTCKIGAMQFVVQDAAEKIFVLSISKSFELIP